jgi:hypothetical protein
MIDEYLTNLQPYDYHHTGANSIRLYSISIRVSYVLASRNGTQFLADKWVLSKAEVAESSDGRYNAKLKQLQQLKN